MEVDTELIALFHCKYASVVIATSEQYILLPSPVNKTHARIHDLNNSKRYKDLEGHTSIVNYLCFGNSGHIFVTACKNIINVWKLKESDDEHDESIKVASTRVAQNFGSVTCISLSKDDRKVCICVENEIWIIDIQTNESLGQLTLSEQEFVAASFSFYDSQFLISISDSNLYQIWDLDSSTHIYQSSYLSGANVTCLCVHPFEQFFVIGFDDGLVRIYDMTLHNSIHQIDLTSTNKEDQRNDNTAVNVSILSVKYFVNSCNNISSTDSNNAILNLLDEKILLTIGCSDSIYLLDGNSLELMYKFNFQDFAGGSRISMCSQISFSYCTDCLLVFAAQHVLTKDVHVFKATYQMNQSSLCISVLSNKPLMENSPLRSTLTPSVKKDASNKSSSKKVKGVDKLNQPITFNRKIKSSGYTKDKPRQQMFKPKINKRKDVDYSNRVGPWGLKQETREPKEDYPIESPAPTNFKIESQLSKDKLPINDLHYTDSGKSLIVAMTEETALLLKPRTLETSLVLTGHDGSVSTARMGHTNRLILTSGVDKTVKLWSPGVNDPILNIDRMKNNFQAEKVSNATVNKENPLLTKDITMTSFYYNDQFILLSHGNSLRMYKYHVDICSKNDDIKRYKTSNRYKLVKSFDITDAHNITTFSTINSFYSYVVLCACSNRDLVLFDINEGKRVQTIHDTHSRPTLSVCQNQGSLFVSHPPQAYDLFLTNAPTDGVKLWDLRLSRCVRRYEGHVNRAHKVGLAFSPCARYIAVGSEDKSTYIYDVRSNSYLHRLSGHNDVVSALSFHPQKPMVMSLFADI